MVDAACVDFASSDLCRHDPPKNAWSPRRCGLTKDARSGVVGTRHPMLVKVMLCTPEPSRTGPAAPGKVSPSSQTRRGLVHEAVRVITLCRISTLKEIFRRN